MAAAAEAREISKRYWAPGGWADRKYPVLPMTAWRMIDPDSSEGAVTEHREKAAARIAGKLLRTRSIEPQLASDLLLPGTRHGAGRRCPTMTSAASSTPSPSARSNGWSWPMNDTPSDPAGRLHVLRGKKKKTGNHANILRELRENQALAGFVAFDEFAQIISLRRPIPDVSGSPEPVEPGFEPRPWRDDDATALCAFLNTQGFPKAPIGIVRDIIVVEARAHGFHPIRDFLGSLAWDGMQSHRPAVPRLLRHQGRRRSRQDDRLCRSGLPLLLHRRRGPRHAAGLQARQHAGSGGRPGRAEVEAPAHARRRRRMVHRLGPAQPRKQGRTRSPRRQVDHRAFRAVAVSRLPRSKL